MSDKFDNPTEEDALDGLYMAHLHCLEQGWDELASEIFDKYQAFAKQTVEE